MPDKNLIDHIEGFLGEIERGWRFENKENKFNIVRFPNQSVEGMNTYVTLGISHHVLSMEERTVRQEILMPAFDSVPKDEIVDFLMRFGDLILTRHEALLRGQVVGPGKPIFSFSPMNAVYASSPEIFDDGFTVFGGTSPATVLVWLIPIHSDEARFIQQNGWKEFEEILVREEPALWDLERESVIAGLVSETG